VYVVPDTKEGWAESVKRLVHSYEGRQQPITFDYTQIRRKGSLIKGFGGISSGAAPLKRLHAQLRTFLDARAAGLISDTRLIADVMNSIGTCVVAGNVRRSAEIAVGSPYDTEFMDLKDYTFNKATKLYEGPQADRAEIGWMSNNSVALRESADFDVLPEIAGRVNQNGEPGILNMLNVQKYGRIGERRPDAATGINPCGEIPLESAELCNLVEVFPTRCRDSAEIFETMALATYYASSVSLLKSHLPETNEVVARNRRIGVSVSGIADWLDQTSVSHVFGVLNRGYEQVIRPTNAALAREAGVAESLRVTTVKPSGTVSLLAGVSPGMHFPVGGTVLRRVRIGRDTAVAAALRSSGVPYEADVVSADTDVFEFPLQYGSGKTRPVNKVSVYEQAAIVAMLQRCWADNAVSNTLTVQPNELDQVERVLALFAPQVKSMSVLPDIDEGSYAQLPLERITKAEYVTRRDQMSDIRWNEVTDDASADASRFCTNDRCEL
jgi:ribonucleoside-diphosphate reductase alpha chain